MADAVATSMADVSISAPSEQRACWVSLDPVNKRVDFYPHAIAQRVEAAYGAWDPAGEMP